MHARAARLYAHNIAFHVLRDYLDTGCLRERYARESAADADKVAAALEKLVTEHARRGGAP